MRLSDDVRGAQGAGAVHRDLILLAVLAILATPLMVPI
jgi:hypothetical protein